MDNTDMVKTSLDQHERWQGKVEVVSRASIETPEDLAVAYTPGVAEPCRAIAADPDASWRYPRRGNLVAVVTDGSAVLGLGNIGPEAGMPVMEGKCALFKTFADVDAFPLCIRSQDVDEIVRTVELLAGSFGGINLEDIAAPRRMGARDVTLCDVDGVVYAGRPGLSDDLAAMAQATNPRDIRGSLADALVDADVLIGVSVAGIVSQDMVRSMAPSPIVFAMANPEPEIMPDAALSAGAVVAATGRSDFPNQINNLLAFPGIFKGALEVRARDISEGMLLAAVDAIAGLIAPGDRSACNIIPDPFDPRVVPAVAAAVAERARKEGLARA